MIPYRKQFLRAVVLCLTGFAGLLAPAVAQAAEGFATANVNMRSGPSTRYPAVTVIPVGTPVEIHGCLSDLPWCDVSFYDGRGWVAGQYVQAEYRQNRVYVEPRYYGTLGIPTVTFELGNYWDRNYRGRDFYRDRDYWRSGSRDRDRYDRDRRPRRDNDVIIVRPGRARDRDNDGFDHPRRDRDRDRDRVDQRRDNDRDFRRDNDRDNRRDRDVRRDNDRDNRNNADRDNRRERERNRVERNDNSMPDRRDEIRNRTREQGENRDNRGDPRRLPCDRPGNNNCE